MKRISNFLSKRTGFYAAAIAIILLLFILFDRTSVLKNALSGLWNIISPVVIGIVVAYLFNPVSLFFERTVFKKIKRPYSKHIWGVVLTAVCFLLIIALLIVALVPSLVKSVTRLISNWDIYTSKLDGLVGRMSSFAAAHNLNVDFSGVENLIDNSMERILGFFKNNYKNVLQVAGEIGTGISNYVIGIVFGFCFLTAKTTILNVLGQIRRSFVREKVIARHNDVLERCHKVFIRYVGCTLLDALIIGVATFIFMFCTSIPYSPLVAVIVAITNIIPTFGPMIGAGLGVFFIILESPVKALIFLAFVIVLQSIDGMIIKPKLFSGSLGIPAVWTLVMIVFSGRVAGVWGIIVSIPLLAILEIIYKETCAPYLNRRAAKINSQEETEKDA